MSQQAKACAGERVNETSRECVLSRHVDLVRGGRRCRRIGAAARRRAGRLRLAGAARTMMSVVMMRALQGLRLLLQRGQRLLRIAQISGLQGVADLVERLREGAVRIAASGL
jgi:uncharacterized protein YceH (UPF0502 family)